jgi:hypothetical protein
MGAELFNTDGFKDGTDITKLLVASRNFVNASKDVFLIIYILLSIDVYTQLFL